MSSNTPKAFYSVAQGRSEVAEERTLGYRLRVELLTLNALHTRETPLGFVG